MSKKFSELGLPEFILNTIEEIGFKTPTPIQEKTIPIALEGKDIIGAAQTGTGKTAAFALPALARLGEPQKRARCLVLLPTRELAIQVEEAFKNFSSQTKYSIALLYGGVKYTQQISALQNGAEIIIATPGRLLDLYQQRYVNLQHIEILILDEVDRMLDMGFIEDVSKIIRHCPKERQTLLFSATISKTISEISKWALQNPIEIDVRTGNLTADTISHAIYPIATYQKYDLLLQLLEHTNYKSVIVFTRTKRDADRITEWLESNQIKVATLHADRTQRERNIALSGFKSGIFDVLVATDIASRGLDISGVSHVINYNVPEHAEDYVHRIGRTGRAGDQGEAFTLFSPDEFPMLQAIEKLLGKPIERRRLNEFNYRSDPFAATLSTVPAKPRRRNR